MKQEKWKQALAMVISITILIILPFFGEIHYKSLYYIAVVLLIPVAIHMIIRKEKYDQRFYTRWHKAREQGFKVNVVRESIKGFTFMMVMVLISQFFGNGLTPIDIAYLLPNALMIKLTLFLMAIGLVTGIVAWYEKEKRYSRIYFEIKKEQEVEN